MEVPGSEISGVVDRGDLGDDRGGRSDSDVDWR